MYALIKQSDNIIYNIIELDNPTNYTPPEGFDLVKIIEGGIGWRYVDGEAIPPSQPEPPVPAIPATVSMRQARLQLLATNHLATVDAAVAAMGAAAGIEWEYATEVRRNNPLVVGIKQLLQWDDTQLDEYFVEAAKL